MFRAPTNGMRRITGIGTTAILTDLRSLNTSPSGTTFVITNCNTLEIQNPSDVYLHFAVGTSSIVATTNSETILPGQTKWFPLSRGETHISVLAPSGSSKELLVNRGTDNQNN